MNERQRLNRQIVGAAAAVLALFVAPQVVGALLSGLLSIHLGTQQLSGLFLLLLLGGGMLLIARGTVGRVSDHFTKKRQLQDRMTHDSLTGLAVALGLNIELDPQHSHPILAGQRRGVWLHVHLSQPPCIVASHRLHLPSRFELREEYLSGSKVELSASERGSWESEKRLQGNMEYDVYTINPDDPDADRQYIKDAVNAIEQLDQSGNRIESNMNYRLLLK